MHILSPRDAARILDISVSRLTQLSRENILPTIRDSSGRRLFDVKEVEKLKKIRATERSTRFGRYTPDGQ